MTYEKWLLLAVSWVPWKRIFRRRHKCLLVVDDDITDADYLATLIEKFGFEARVVTLADTAYELIRHSPSKYKVVFVDLRLPQMSGLRFIDLVSAEFPLLHLVIVAGMPDDVVELRPSLYVGLILKPVSRQSIASVLMKTKL